MAHLIDTTNGKASCFTAGQAPWHRLGVNVKDAQTSAEAIRLANLDWTVSLEPLYTKSGGQLREVAGNFGVTRSDTLACLGVVGGFYKPFQNADCFDFMDNIVGEKLAMFETAGAIKEGRRVWMLARLPKTLQVNKRDTVQPYVLVTNSHDGTSCLRMIPTTVRVVCQNTLSLALRGASAASGVSITHTESLTRRVAEARKSLGIVMERVDQFGEQIQSMARVSMSTEKLNAFFTGLVSGRAEKQQKKLLNVFLDNFENERQSLPGTRGTLWAAFNAVTEYADHDMTVFGKTDLDRTDNRLNSIWFGNANRLKQEAFEAALTLMAI